MVAEELGRPCPEGMNNSNLNYHTTKKHYWNLILGDLQTVFCEMPISLV